MEGSEVLASERGEGGRSCSLFSSDLGRYKPVAVEGKETLREGGGGQILPRFGEKKERGPKMELGERKESESDRVVLLRSPREKNEDKITGES